ncbi:MAG: ROK family protein [Candidatus Rokubacteria bacterium]|nr:ROK family protein [Candidatus Rokubacteria bacterium]
MAGGLVRVLIGVDIGGTTTAGGLVTGAGEVLSVVRVPTHRHGPGTGVETLLDVVADLLARARARGIALDGIGVGIAGPVDVEKGMMLPFPNHVPEFGDVPIAARLGALAGVPAFVDNDVRALALAESTFGHGRGASPLVVLAIGSGVGGGIVIDGRPVRGRHGWGGEIGHFPVRFDGPRCNCGGRGCLGAYLSGRQIAARARERVADHPDSALLALAGGDGAQITAALVFRTAADGDPLAGALVDEACEALAASLAGIVNALDPEVLVITGGVVASLLPLEADIRRRVARCALSRSLDETRIHFVAADKRATVLGGAALALYELGRREAITTPDPSEV